MGQLFRTSITEDHSHIVYVSEVSQTGVTSVDAGHIHDVAFDPNIQDWVLGFGPNGHSHVLEAPTLANPKSDKQEDVEVLDDVYTMFREWTEAEKESRDAAEEAEKFYWGEQWDKALKSELESKGRAALTINQIERMVDSLTGEQRQERTDIHYYPEEGGDQRVADILNHLSKHLLEKCYYGREEAKVFEDMVIVGRGGFNLWVDFSKDIQGQIKVERFPWSDVVFAPHEKEDLEDCEGLIKHKMYSRARLKSMFPDFADKIDGVFVDQQLPITAASSNVPFSPNYDFSANGESFPVVSGDYSNIDILRKELRVIECWRKVFGRLNVIAYPDENFYFAADGWKNSDVNKVRTIPGFYVVEREQIKFRITKVCGNLILSDDYPADLPDNDFFLVPAYAKKRGGRWKGKVTSGIDSQKEVNKRHSQAIDIGNQAGYGWFYDDTTFPDERAKLEFTQNSSAPNFKLKLTSVQNPPLRQDGLKFPAEIVQLMQMADQSLSSTMSMEAMPGGANQSGAHFMEAKKAKLLPNEFLFDNLSFAKKKVGTLLVKLIQRYYRPERILRILQNQATQAGPQNMQVGGQPFDSYTSEEIISILQTSDLSQYDVTVAESGYSPTARLATFMLLSEMARSGSPVPPELMVEFMDIPAELKQKIQSSMMQQAQAQAQTQDANSKMEINKTLIAQGIIPPEVQAQLGGQGQQMPQGQEPEMLPPPEANGMQ